MRLASVTFPIEGWTPWLIKVRTEGTSVEILQKVPLTLPSGAPATGLPNNNRDEPVLQCDGVTASPYNPNGLDTEDLVRTLDGNFWLVDEHSPSIVKVSPGGQVSKRFLPAGLALPGTEYTVANNLPQIYGAKRKQNRGFEGITLGWTSGPSTLPCRVRFRIRPRRSEMHRGIHAFWRWTPTTSRRLQSTSTASSR